MIEHDCNNYHYGDMSIVRPCCVDFTKAMKASAIKNALTHKHPAYVAFIEGWNGLTDKERELVGDCYYNLAKGGVYAK